MSNIIDIFVPITNFIIIFFFFKHLDIANKNKKYYFDLYLSIIVQDENFQVGIYKVYIINILMAHNDSTGS